MGLERQRTILDTLGSCGFCSVEYLAQLIGISSVTIRRDLATLEAQGLIKRVHGGATLPESMALAKPMSWREHERREQKQRIAAHVVSLFKRGQTVMLDAGSTCLCVAEAIPSTLAIRVITHALPNMTALAGKSAVELVGISGSYDRDLAAFVGPSAEASLAQYHADISVLAAAHVNVDQGLVNNHTAEWTIKRTIHSHAERCVLAIDSSKFGVRGLQSTIPMDELRCEIVTDAGLSDDQRRLFGERGVKVTVV
jgi:DeoR/GlpR family transcriptional regulator of sugar metabolism